MPKVAILILCLLILTACSSKPPQASTTIQATLSETAIQPGLWRIPAGQLITLNLSNIGKENHSWVLLKDPPTEPFSADDELNSLFQMRVAPGETISIEFRAPAAPGEYSVTSSLPGDLEKGLTAKVVAVQPGY